MKRTHIINLKSEVDKQTRIEVYVETLARAQKSNFLIERGFCFGLPMVLWGLETYKDPCPSGIWSHGHTGVAFPEITTEVLKDLDRYSGEKGNDRRIEYLKEWIDDLMFG